MISAKIIEKELISLRDADRSEKSKRYFKTGPGEYAEGDIFLGIPVPILRNYAKKWYTLPRSEIIKLLHSPLHELRFIALCIAIQQFKRGDDKIRKNIVNLYLASLKKFINNWDLVDLSAANILGAYYTNASKQQLIKLARSSSLWEKRAAIIATHYYIKSGSSDTALLIATILLQDKHDLIHKAVGWTLREVGKSCSMEVEREFLELHIKLIPRTTLRYAIERFPTQERRYLLNR
ncbi:MAG TPA: DNA alkylation repair protein [bacterium]|nr:DNA alkylation repair protein [bacterium]